MTKKTWLKFGASLAKIHVEVRRVQAPLYHTALLFLSLPHITNMKFLKKSFIFWQNR
jgi:hypothetical protein